MEPTHSTPNPPRRKANWRLLLQILGMGALILILQIPIEMIGSIVWERDDTRRLAINEVAEKWGGPQRAVGPFLLVPYRYWNDHIDEDKKLTRVERMGSYFASNRSRRVSTSREYQKGVKKV